MAQVPVINDQEIRDRVESLVGKNTRILDCEKKSSLMTEEVLLLNGQQVKLVGEAGERIKAALKAGQSPPPEVLAEILKRAGIQHAPIEVETVMTVKSNTKTSELSTLKDRAGNMVDEKLKEFEEDDEFESTNVELWEKEPEELREQMEREKSRMWDFYKSNMEPFLSSVKPEGSKYSSKGSPTVTAEYTQETFDRNVTSETTGRKPQSQRSRSDIPSSSGYSSKKSSQDLGSFDIPGSTTSSPSPTPYHYPDHSERSTNSPSEIYRGESPQVPTTPLEQQFNMSRSFGNNSQNKNLFPTRMPPLSKPSNPLVRPIVPPKPQYFKDSEFLKREKNFRLPVRVVYETFI